MGRFINADTHEVIDGANDHMLENNLFAYCFNNPVNLEDSTGTWPSWATKVLIGVAVIAAVAVVTVATGGAGAGVAGFIAAGALKGAVIGCSHRSREQCCESRSSGKSMESGKRKIKL